MKLDRQSIRFRFWLVFFLLAVGITLFIGILQMGLIRPYYRNSKVRSVETVAETVSEDLIEKGDAPGISDAMKQAVDNNVCIVMYNDSGSVIYQADSLGAGCIFNAPARERPDVLRSFETVLNALSVPSLSFTQHFDSPTTNQEMVVYAKTIRSEFANYYILVNSPLEPVDSILSFFARQYFIYMILAILLASFIAFYIARQITEPIVKMKNEAQKLARADYSASFDGGSFTETKELAGALNNADEKLGKIDELRRDLIANVSHDIRTPLTNIRAYTEMIHDISGDNKEKREKHLSVIIKETEYMNRLINDMTELSMMQTGNLTLHKENVDLAERIREIAEMDLPLLKKGGLKLHLEVPETLTVYADDAKIGQVCANYLSNAIKHTPQGGDIWVRAYTRADEETVHFEVQDSGEGIPEDELPYIWDRYQKSSRSFSRSQTSTGLGLSIVKAIAEAHHARYGVKTEEGKGSTFWFELRETHEA